MLAPPQDGRRHTRAVFDESYFFGDGVGYADYTQEAALQKRRGQWYAELLARHGVVPSSVLDVGTAAGYFLQGFAAEGRTLHGIEPCEELAQLARAGGLDVTSTSLEESPGIVAPADLVTAVQLVEHLTDLDASGAALAHLVRSGGHLLVETWNWRSWMARAQGTRWHEYSPPSVRQWFTPDSLERWLAPAGFTAVGDGRPRKRITWAHARAVLEPAEDGVTPAWPLRVGARIADTILHDDTELAYPPFDLFWMLFRRADA